MNVAERYPQPRRRGLVALAVVLGAVGAAWLGWAAWSYAHPAVAADVVAFDVTSDTDVAVTLRVQRDDPSRPARCLVYAQAESFLRVGELPVDIAAGTSEITDVAVALRTFERATSASVEGCALID